MRASLVIATLALALAIVGVAPAATRLLDGATVRKGTISGDRLRAHTLTLDRFRVAPQASVGRMGDRGPQGDPGLPGDVGADGPQGDPGATGQPGLEGADGAPGRTGPAGSAGAPGPNGNDGTVGVYRATVATTTLDGSAADVTTATRVGLLGSSVAVPPARYLLTASGTVLAPEGASVGCTLRGVTPGAMSSTAWITGAGAAPRSFSVLLAPGGLTGGMVEVVCFAATGSPAAVTVSDVTITALQVIKTVDLA